MKNYRIIQGDNLESMREMPDNSVDSIVTDPPYGLSFMAKRWDYDVPSVETWREAIRVLKPGGHLLAFGGSRTYHRLVIPIEDAGFEIRDQIMWLYGSGFPKSHNVAKAIDKAAGAEPNVRGYQVMTGSSRRTVDGKSLGAAVSSSAAPAERVPTTIPLTEPATPDAQKWDGWGTALKPAHEPIVVARKPLIGTVAANVLEHGTGAMNIDACRVPSDAATGWGGARGFKNTHEASKSGGMGSGDARPVDGRWPANVIHDGSAEVVAHMPTTGPSRKSDAFPGKIWGDQSLRGMEGVVAGHDDNGGSVARYFYSAKASKHDRDEGLENFDENTAGERTGRKEGSAGINAYAGATGPARNIHPTVKPTDLMRYLCRLVTPPGGVVLDPFCGSGSTGKAALLEGFRFVGLELDPDYARIAEARLAHAERARAEEVAAIAAASDPGAGGQLDIEGEILRAQADADGSGGG